MVSVGAFFAETSKKSERSGTEWDMHFRHFDSAFFVYKRTLFVLLFLTVNPLEPADMECFSDDLDPSDAGIRSFKRRP